MILELNHCFIISFRNLFICSIRAENTFDKQSQNAQYTIDFGDHKTMAGSLQDIYNYARFTSLLTVIIIYHC